MLQYFLVWFPFMGPRLNIDLEVFMKKTYVLLVSLLLTTVVSSAAVKTTKHAIKNGETLYTIAHANHTTIEEVRKANGLKKGERLKLGRVLTVPKDTYFPNKKKSSKKIAKVTKKSTKKVSPKIVKHKIKNGETLYTIAHANHTTIEEVRKANGLKKGEKLKLGRVLKVPKNTYSPNRKKSTKKVARKTSKKSTKKLAKYRIKKGDTLSSIAHKHHTTIAKIQKDNHMKKGETLKLGRTLKVATVKKSTPKKVRVTKKASKKSNKKLVASLSKLETVKLKKQVKIKKKKSSSFSLGDIFFSSKKTKVKSSRITSLAKTKLGRRYVWGASGAKNTFDCSGFTTYVYKKNGIKLPRRAIAQSKYGKYISRKNLKKGDLIFFDTSKRRRGYVNHVGIYLGNGKFIHASSAKKKVVITSLKNFYAKRYKGARRPS